MIRRWHHWTILLDGRFLLFALFEPEKPPLGARIRDAIVAVVVVAVSAFDRGGIRRFAALNLGFAGIRVRGGTLG